MDMFNSMSLKLITMAKTLKIFEIIIPLIEQYSEMVLKDYPFAYFS